MTFSQYNDYASVRTGGRMPVLVYERSSLESYTVFPAVLCDYELVIGFVQKLGICLLAFELFRA